MPAAATETRGAAPRAVALDYNGTLSDDEALLEEIYLTVLADAGAPIDAAKYRAHLRGLTDSAVIREGLRLGGVATPGEQLCSRVLDARREKYAAAVERRPTISEEAVAFVRDLAAALPLAVVSGAPRSEVEAGLAVAGITADIAVLVTVEDVRCGKPDPEPYHLAVQRLRARVEDLAPEDVVAVEDAAPGIAAARAAGLRCASVVPGLGADLELAGLSLATASQLR
jgi:HAD superfamily hydrolase (TIGR01509 family)